MIKNKYIHDIVFPNGYDIESMFFSENRLKQKITEEKVVLSEYDRRYSELTRLKKKELIDKGVVMSMGENPKLTKKEKTITETTYYVELYPKKFSIIFKSGINLIVGENGCGKSTLINIIHNVVNNKYNNKKYNVNLRSYNLTTNNFCGWDFEKDNPQSNKLMKPNPEDNNFLQKTLFLMSCNEESHGETTRGVLDKFISTVKNCLIVLDEPETALSLKAQYQYWQHLKKLAENNQIIIITHSKVFMEEQKEVYDMETKQWLDVNKYFNIIKK